MLLCLLFTIVTCYRPLPPRELPPDPDPEPDDFPPPLLGGVLCGAREDAGGEYDRPPPLPPELLLRGGGVYVLAGVLRAPPLLLPPRVLPERTPEPERVPLRLPPLLFLPVDTRGVEAAGGVLRDPLLDR